VRVEHPEERLADLVLDERTARGLGHALALARHHDALSGRRRAGMTMLLTGPPGTGKTMAARALASELARPLHHVDLASTVSKWLGETEKNLARALRACEAIGGVLLFDEGEALFGERGEVSRGADRYANLEVAYLLQALEAHEGIVVVTTNAPDKIDGAFLRRFDLVLELPPPDAMCRAALLQRELGEAGRAMELDMLARIAERVELSGGHLAAAARLARTLALGAGRIQVHEADVLEALAFEQEKRGDLLSAARLRGDAARAVVAAP
jgi:SpoVK/Ycf46/Vps4 family AAA+-type ATPase